MSWFKRSTYFFAFFMVSCTGQQKDAAPAGKNYFDLAGYFKSQGENHAREKTAVRKTILKNGRSESKTLQIGDWEKEFSLFAGSDINKPAWTSSYETSENGDTVVYRAIDPTMRTQLIRIAKSGDAVGMIYIKNQEENTLYKSMEELHYFPDSLYRIEKKQDVRFIGVNEYRIEGRFANE